MPFFAGSAFEETADTPKATWVREQLESRRRMRKGGRGALGKFQGVVRNVGKNPQSNFPLACILRASETGTPQHLGTLSQAGLLGLKGPNMEFRALMGGGVWLVAVSGSMGPCHIGILPMEADHEGPFLGPIRSHGVQQVPTWENLRTNNWAYSPA